MLWSFVLELVGMVGAYLVGRRYWLAWLVLALNSLAWSIYGMNTRQYGFTLAALAYCPLYLRNGYLWRRRKTLEASSPLE